MPSGNLPALNFLGDGQRTTGEFQAAVNELQNYVVSLKNEVDALSNTIVKEPAVRDIGAAAGNVPDTAVLNTRLATTGNLGDAAQSSLNKLIDITLSVAAGGSNAGNVGATSSEAPLLAIYAYCTTNSGVGVNMHDDDPDAGLGGVFLQSSFGQAKWSIINNSAATESFRIIVYRLTTPAIA